MLDPDFEKLVKGYSLVTVDVLYWLPNYRSLVQEFKWQAYDLKPKYPRIDQFLDFWRREIDARIKEVTICDAGIFIPKIYRNLDGIYPIK
jgi:uncharacterized protein Usg